MKYVLVCYDQNRSGATSWVIEAANGTEAYTVARHHLITIGIYPTKEEVLLNYQKFWMIIPCQGVVGGKPNLRVVR